jgi:hypothetical protein
MLNLVRLIIGSIWIYPWFNLCLIKISRLRLCNHGDKQHLENNKPLNVISSPSNLNSLLSLYFSF